MFALFRRFWNWLESRARLNTNITVGDAGPKASTEKNPIYLAIDTLIYLSISIYIYRLSMEGTQFQASASIPDVPVRGAESAIRSKRPIGKCNDIDDIDGAHPLPSNKLIILNEIYLG
jgi:hypothetical protein